MDSIEQSRRYKEQKKADRIAKKTQLSLSKQKLKQSQKPKGAIKVLKKNKRVKWYRTWDACLRKYERWEKLYLKEEQVLEDYLIWKADSLCSKYVKYRDSKRWKLSMIVCITHKADWCQVNIDPTNNDQCNNCHWIGREWYSHRRKLFNCNAGCISCNAFHKEAHKQEYDAVMINRYWHECYNKFWTSKNKIKPSIDDLLSIIDDYEKLLSWEHRNELCVENEWII